MKKPTPKHILLASFIDKARLKHGDKYDYSKVVYENTALPVCIICPKHGEFWQRPCVHLNGHECPACKGLKKITKEEFIRRANEVHHGKYDYSKVEVHGIRGKVEIICPEHGPFMQTVKNHMKGQGCPHCGARYAREWRKNDPSDFLNTSRERFGENYTFPNIYNEYENSHSKITIRCKKCGNTFIKIACDHLTSPFGGCRHCYASQSGMEVELANFIKGLLPNEEIRLNDRDLLDGMEVDIYIPSRNLAIEYNGCFWHSEACKEDKYYHLTKTERCERKGVQLIQVFEDEFRLHNDIVVGKLKHILNNNVGVKIHARQCRVSEIEYELAKGFLDKNHIQGHDKPTVRVGLFYDENIIAVMTFIKDGEGKWTLNRYATASDIRLIGGASKMFSYFVRVYQPVEVKSFADRRWSTTLKPNLYDRLGFKLESVLRPDYRYILHKDIVRYHKFGFRKEILHKKYGFPLEMTESEMMNQIKAHRIWDCGLLKYSITFDTNIS